MTRFLTAFSSALDPAKRAEALLAGIEAERTDGRPMAGGLILATSACGADCYEVGRRLAECWPSAALAGTSFEGVLAGGRIYRDEPAMVLLAWPEQDDPAPTLFGLDPGEADPLRLAEVVFEAAGRSELEAGDLVLLFADAHGSLAFDESLARVGSSISPASLAGAGTTGIDGRDALVFLDGEAIPGASVGLFIPGSRDDDGQDAALVRCASATRAASPWLEITKCRARWIDELEGERALDWVRRQLGLDSDSPIEPHLDQLLARVRRARTGDSPEEDVWPEERYVVGLDARRGSFSWAGPFSAGDQLALALPDRTEAREALRNSIGQLKASRIVLQFACRARDEALHGDSDLESAWAAHCAEDRDVIGTVAPFQFATNPASGGRILVHSTVLAALGKG